MAVTREKRTGLKITGTCEILPACLSLFVDRASSRRSKPWKCCLEEHCVQCLFEWMLLEANYLFKINTNPTDSSRGAIYLFQVCTTTMLNMKSNFKKKKKN